MTRRLVFPSLRCAMGNWIYYVTAMTFGDVAAWLKPTREIHESTQLADWIQRQLDDQHANRIAKYLRTQSERLFNAIVVGVYGAEPEWSELRVRDPQDRISPEDEDHLKRTLGILAFQGEEHLFAIDGQHRVAGIKRAIETTASLASEEITVILVAHVDSAVGRRRTRRLFTTLNKRAKRVSKADIVALDEDNGFAVVARRLVDEFTLLNTRELVAFEGTASIKPSDQKSLTSVIGLYELAIDLYPSQSDSLPKRNEFMSTRPGEAAIKEVYDTSVEFWTLLAKRSSEYKEVFGSKAKVSPGTFRAPTNNHLLFRPAGQRAFAGALRILLDRNPSLSMPRAMSRLLELNLWLHESEWHRVLWDPLQRKMLSANRVLAESHLLAGLGEKARSADAQLRYEELIAKRDAEGSGRPSRGRKSIRRRAKGGRS